MRYKKQVEHLIENSLIDRDEVYFYDSENEEDFEVFDMLFEFYQNRIESLHYYGIKPCVIFFRNSEEFSARASKYRNTNLVKINKGLVIRLQEIFLTHDDIFLEYEEHKTFLKTQENLNTDILSIMYFAASHFVFYHELAHIIQYSDYLEQGLDEVNIVLERFDFRRHQLEIDADVFSSVEVANYGKQIILEKLGKNPDPVDIRNLLILIATAVFICLLCFPSNKRAIYYKECTHPHPLIRNLVVTSKLIDILSVGLLQKGIKVWFEEHFILGEVFALTNELSESIFGFDILAKLKIDLPDEVIKVSEYSHFLAEQNKNDENLSITKSIKIAKKLNPTKREKTMKVFLPKGFSEDEIYEVQILAYQKISDTIEVEPDRLISPLEIVTITSIGIFISSIIGLCFKINEKIIDSRLTKKWDKQRLIKTLEDELIRYNHIEYSNLKIENFDGLINDTYSPCLIEVTIKDETISFKLYRNGEIYKIEKST